MHDEGIAPPVIPGPDATGNYAVPETDYSAAWKAAVVIAIIVGAAVGYGYYAGWYSTPRTGFSPPTCPGNFTLAGSSSAFGAPLLSVWSSAFESYLHCLTISYRTSPPTEALTAFQADQSVYLASEVPLSSSEAVGLHTSALTLPTALGAVAVVYDLPGHGPGLRLSPAVLAGIYSGTITTWDDPQITALNPGVDLGQAPAITVFHSGLPSGTTEILTQYLSEGDPSWNASMGAAMSVNWTVGQSVDDGVAMARAVQNTSGAIGYLALGNALQGGLSTAALENPSGDFVLPSSSTLSTAGKAGGNDLPAGNADWENVSLVDRSGSFAYPMTAFLYVILYENLGAAYAPGMTLNSAEWLVSFIYWTVFIGQNYTSAIGFAPLPLATQTADIQTFELMRYASTLLASDPDYDHDALPMIGGPVSIAG